MTSPNLLSLFFATLIVSSIVMCNAADDGHEFSYEEDSPTGPNNWGTLTSEWQICSGGKVQSPIDIDTKTAKHQAVDLKKDYKEAPAKLVNKHHAIAVEWEGDAGSIEVNGSTYKLVQCHWHTPAEHTINGKRYDAELHFVHKNDKDELAVLGILYAVGESDPFVKNVIADKIKTVSTKGVDLGKVSASTTTSDNKRYFRYFGSLTTPPCSEGVTWTVAEKVRPISADQIKLLQGPLDVDFQENSRPTQDLDGRTVTQFEDKEGASEDKGHSGAVSLSNLKNGIIITMLIQFFISFLF